MRLLHALPEGGLWDGTRSFRVGDFLDRTERRASVKLAEHNEAALAARPAQDQERAFSPVSEHSQALHALKRQHRYFGYVEVEIEGTPPFVMFLNDDDQIAYIYFWYGRDAFETHSLRLWTRLARESGVIFDVGAFTGVYTLAAAVSNREASIHSFEPVGLAFSRLLTNLSANRLGKKAPGASGAKIAASKFAVGDSDGEARINQFRNELTLGTGASLVEKPGKEVQHSESIRQVTVDGYAREVGLEKIDLIKADVEQAELLLVDGMQEVIEEHRPSLMIEVSSERNLQTLADRLEPYGYNFAIINDQAQSCSFNSVSDFSRVCNVLFRATSESRLKEFCDSVKPLDGNARVNADRQKVLGPSKIDEQLRALSKRARKSKKLEEELRTIKSSNAWILARNMSKGFDAARKLVWRR